MTNDKVIQLLQEMVAIRTDELDRVRRGGDDAFNVDEAEANLVQAKLALAREQETHDAATTSPAATKELTDYLMSTMLKTNSVTVLQNDGTTREFNWKTGLLVWTSSKTRWHAAPAASDHDD